MMEALSRHGKYKLRSHETSRDRHLQELDNSPTGPLVVLLGDSMIERMITTGHSPSFEPWPSEGMIDNDAIAQNNTQTSSSAMRRLNGIFNAGVGGDKFENIAYRLAGSLDPLRPLRSLLYELGRRDVKLWVLHAGTNNLHCKRGMSETDLALLVLILEALLDAGGKVLLTGLFQRKDMSEELVAKANRQYQRISQHFAKKRPGQIEFLAPPVVDMDECMVDHVHLNERGYHVWAKTLLKEITDAIR